MAKLMLRDSNALEVLPSREVLTLYPSDDLVVTITKDGNPLSRFGDDIWDYGATSSTMKTLNFRAKIDKITPVDGCRDASENSRSSANKFLKTLALHWISVVGGCSMSKLNGDVVAASFLVRFCLDKGIPVRNIFSTPEAIDFLIVRALTVKQAGLLLGKIQRFTDTATVLGNNLFWEGLRPSVEFQNKLKRVRKSFPETTDTVQTLLIPSEIYQGILKKTIDDLDRFLEHEEAIKFLFQIRTLARDKGVSLDKKLDAGPLTKNQAARVTIQWNKLMQENSKVSMALKELSEAGISKSESWAGLMDNLNRWQLRCAILIAAFTGMRKSELLAIPLNGFKTLNTSNGAIPVVWSTTTKLENNGVPRFTKWVTSSIVEAAFKVARIIAEGALAWSDDRRITDVKEQETPLFLSVEYGKKGIPHPQFRFTTTSFNGRLASVDLYKKELQVSEQDIAETSWFLYGENVPSCIKVGEAWPLTFHQFRRSMAVYAAASGRVSYPVLKAQLKHISMVMTVYYSDSNSRAVNILGNEAEVKALRAEWADAKARVEADDLYKLLESGQPLAGSAGKRLRAQQARVELPDFLESRKMTKQAVKNGKIRYRPTLVGGCMSVKPCNKGAGVLASACISCEDSVFLPGSKAALEQTKEFYEAELAEGAPKRARQEYKANIKKIDSFMQNLIETVEIA